MALNVLYIKYFFIIQILSQIDIFFFLKIKHILRNNLRNLPRQNVVSLGNIRNFGLCSIKFEIRISFIIG